MSPKSLFSRISQQVKPKNNTSANQHTPPPPPYSEPSIKQNIEEPTANSHTTPSTSYRDTLHAKTSSLDIATDCIPQWKWTNGDCRYWLFLMLVEMCGWEELKAYDVANRWAGFGPYLYGFSDELWRQKLGLADGRAIYTVLLSMRNSEGAVPSTSFIKMLYGRLESQRQA